MVLFCFWIEASTNSRFELYSKATVTWIGLVQVVPFASLKKQGEILFRLKKQAEKDEL